jgi:hypothetical protein
VDREGNYKLTISNMEMEYNIKIMKYLLPLLLIIIISLSYYSAFLGVISGRYEEGYKKNHCIGVRNRCGEKVERNYMAIRFITAPLHEPLYWGIVKPTQFLGGALLKAREAEETEVFSSPGSIRIGGEDNQATSSGPAIYVREK